MSSLPFRSALARTLEPQNVHNRAVVVGALVALGLARARGLSWADALNGAGSAFVTWSTARELDPDHPEGADAALGLTFLRRADPGEALAGLGALSGLRLLVGTTGEAPTRADHIALALQTAISAHSGSRLLALIPAVAAAWRQGSVAGDALWPLLGLLVPPARVRADHPDRLALPLVLAALAAGSLLREVERVRAPLDRVPGRVSDEDLHRARLLALGVLAAGALSGQTLGMRPLALGTFVAGARRFLSAPQHGLLSDSQQVKVPVR